MRSGYFISCLSFYSSVYVVRTVAGLPLRWAAPLYFFESLLAGLLLKWKGGGWLGGLVISLVPAFATVLALSYSESMSLVYYENLGLALSMGIPPIAWYLCGARKSGRAFAYGTGVYFLFVLVLSSWVIGNSNFFLAPAQIALSAFVWVGFMATLVLRFRRLSPQAVQSLVID